MVEGDRRDRRGWSRRAVVRAGALWLAPAGLCARALANADAERKPALTLGLVTDPHAADKDAAGERHYRASAQKLTDAVAHFNTRRCEAAVCLGDIVDRAELERELAFLDAVERVYAGFRGERYYVLGNHCVDTLTKDEFIERTAKREPFESFDAGGWHFVLLDACFTAEGKPYGRRNFRWTDANVPEEELRWLAADLKATRLPTVVCAHQNLDRADNYAVRNAPAVREVIARSGKVRAVLQGHRHVNGLTVHDGVPYVTLMAMVEGPEAKADNAFSTLACFGDGSLRLDGFARQRSWDGRGATVE